jgi:transposase
MDYWDKPPMSREQMVLFAPTLDAMIPQDHAVRLYDEILHGCDWAEWEGKYNGRLGRPPIRPRVMASVILYGLSRGVRSSRHLEYLVSHNVDFIWLVEGRKIDHSTICDFRTNFRDALKDLFRRICRIALTMGVARLGEVALDGTRIKSNNGRFETLTAEGIEARLAALDEELERMLAEADAADQTDRRLFDTGESSQQLPPQLADMKARQQRLQEALQKVQAADKARRAEGINSQKNPAQIPTTDGDSRVLPNKEGGYAPNYTPMLATEVHGGFILDTDLIASTHEHTTTIPSMDRIKDGFGEFPEAALADGVHATGPNIQAMEERGIDFFSHVAAVTANETNPALRDDPTQPVEESEKENLPRNPQTKKFDKSAFIYDEEKDVWYCPQGKVLPYNEKKSKVDAEGTRTYFNVYRGEDCVDCAWSSDCRMEKAKRGRSVSRDEHAKLREQFAQKMSQPESQKIYRKRFHAAETPFGILKRVMNLRQFLHRGLEKVKTEWLWACTAFNLAKLVRETARLRADFSKLIAQGAG